MNDYPMRRIGAGVAALVLFGLGYAGGLIQADYPFSLGQPAAQAAVQADYSFSVGQPATLVGMLAEDLGAADQPDLDVRKFVIESPVKALIQARTGAPGSADKGKQLVAEAPDADPTKRLAIELPAKTVVAEKSAPTAPPPDFANPKVAPGKVHWHDKFADACAASAKSGKPILLFQMLGKLDDQFC